ncbi:MAG TPA: sortase [Candidatus Saccharimonadales bacterium]|jgi:hypothetical protein|nr:sortase [Candidatus Saccharimonadales bacterium]
MQAGHSLVEKVRYYSSVSTVYLLTLLFAFMAVHPPAYKKQAVILARAVQLSSLPAAQHITVITGEPVRIVIPGSGIDLPVDQGYYNSSQASWTLSGYHAQYAMISQLANNVAGDTFLYGHNNNYVFGALRHNTPAVGAQALIYTDNGHIFEYNFVSATSLAPDDASIFSYEGPPVMTIQTCTGSLNEWRTMYRFNFVRVQQ